MKTKTSSFLMQLPLILVMIASFFASIYAAAYKISGIGFLTPVVLGIIIVLYFLGRHFEKNKRNDF
ncbi:MAG: hypothetical protein WCP89_02780 [archaeon]